MMAGAGDGGARAAERPAPLPLVTTSISQQDRFEIFPTATRVVRPGTGKMNSPPPDRSGTTLEGFSDKSRANLRFFAENSKLPLVSQFGLTYHNEWPTDGRTSKAHLNAWLTAVRRLLPDVGYLWLLEFQKRKAPHYHVFLTVPPDEQIRLKLAEAWCRITSPGDSEALRFHQDRRNWIAWEMQTANYLCKYLDKEAQKDIPDGYSNFGRFWGNSRNIKPVPRRTIPIEDAEHISQLDHETGEIYGGSATIIRWLGRLAERQTKGFSKFRKRAATGSYTMRRGAAAFEQIERYFDALPVKGCPF